MSSIFSSLGIDFDNLNLNRLQIGAVNFNYLDNAFVTVNGILYADIYEVVWNYNGNFFSSVFAGPNLIRNPSTGAISGTVTGYVESFWNGSTYQPSWGVENINSSAAALWNASLTPSNTDDLAIIRQALSGADNFYGSSQTDKVNGFEGNDVLHGGAGNDVIGGGAGNDVIDGGTGDDTAMFSQGLGNCLVQDLGSRTVVSGPDGSDTLTGVEHLRFADGTVHVNDGNPMFDTLFYMRNNVDVFHSGGNALDHFNNSGWHEGRDPNPFFDTSWYLATNPEVRASGVNPLTHYQTVGWREGRDPGPNFDTKAYLMHNPDVAAAGVDPLGHFLQSGILEGRTNYKAIGNPVNGFDAGYYLEHNPDVAAAGVDPLAHFNSSGWHEGRNPNAEFDTKGYLAHYADVAAAGVNPLTHYENFGWKEGRDPSVHFDTTGYLAANPDVAAAHVNPLDHYLTNGIYEGRAVIDDGLWG